MSYGGDVFTLMHLLNLDCTKLALELFGSSENSFYFCRELKKRFFMKTFINLTSTFILDTFYYDAVLVAQQIARNLNVNVDCVTLFPVNLLEHVWCVRVSVCSDDVKRDLSVLLDTCSHYSTTL